MTQPSSNPYLVPRELLDKYNTAGPRYTSYPTAPEWRDDVRKDEAIAIIDANNVERADVPLSLYVHLPFCHKLCYYCGCNMLVTKKQDLVERYLDALFLEIDHVADHIDAKRRKVVQIHWGGGTPTYLNSEQIERLFNKLAPPFPRAKLLRFDGSTTGDVVEVELQFGLFKQRWQSLIVEHGQDSQSIWFVDEGKQLPFFLKSFS